MTQSVPAAGLAVATREVLEAEATWLKALVEGDNAMLALMLDDCVVVHGPVGKIDGPQEFATFASTRRKTAFARTENVDITLRRSVAVVTCLQEMHIYFAPDLPPFPVQEAMTRVWEATDEGWRLAHMHQQKRQAPA
jgi:ketosteroid isomerase-like protein